MKMLARAALLLLAILAAPAIADSPSNGLPIGAPASFVPTQAAAFADANGKAVVIDLNHPLPIAGGIQGQVVSGDQAYAVGSVQTLNLTATGRLKVGISSAGNIDPAAQLATTLHADLAACKYRASVAWSIGWTGSVSCDASGNLLVADTALLTALNSVIAQAAPRTFAPAAGVAESSTAASYTFSTASQALARGWYANCPTGTTVVVTLIGVNGGSAPRTLYDGWQDNDDRLAGFAGNSVGCTIGERF